MIFKKLFLKNIRSYEELEVEFPPGSILLSGDIGAGKTSILLGLQFALFGLQPGQKGASILRQGESSAKASLELEIDGQQILLERSIKKSPSGSISQDSNSITIDGQKEELSTSEMKEKVIKLLNYPKEFTKKSNLLYKFTVYTPQEEMKAIIQERPEVRLDTLRHIFGIDRYKRIKENANIFLQKLKESIKIKEVLCSELNLLKEKLSIENEKKISLARKRNSLEIDKNLKEKELEKLKEKIRDFQKKTRENEELQKELSKASATLQGKKDLEMRLKKEAALMQKQIENKASYSPERFKSLKELLEKHKRILEEKNSELLEISSKISGLESKKESPLKIREKIISLTNCPTCFQEVCDEHKEKISKRTQYEIEDINRELEEKLIRKNKLISEIEREKSLVRGYESDFAKISQEKIKYEHQKEIETKLKSDAFVLERTINEIKSLESLLQKLRAKSIEFKSSMEEFERVKEEFERASGEFRKIEIEFATREKELELLKKSLADLEEEIAKKEKIQEDLFYLRGLKDWISEKFISLIDLTEKNVLVRLRNEFSQLFNEWFLMLVSDSLSVRLDEDFTPIISNQDYDIEYEFLSGGERTSVALAYRLALNQVLNSMLSRIKTKDIVILDEPTDGFASEQIDKMRDIFEQLNAKQLILVSHEQKIEGFVDHILRVRKSGSSRVE